MVGEACLPSNAYYPRTPDYTLYSGVHVCWSEHSDSSFVNGFMSLNYGLRTMTATTVKDKPLGVEVDFSISKTVKNKSCHYNGRASESKLFSTTAPFEFSVRSKSI